MSDLIGRWTITGKPQSASRPRVGRRGTHYPDAHRIWEARAVHHISLHRAGEAHEGPVDVTIVAVFPRPKARLPRHMGGTLSVDEHRDWACMYGLDNCYGRMPAHTASSDVDNVAKLCMDALQKAGVLVNDSRVVKLVIRKLWTAVDDDPCTEIVVRRARV